MRFHFQRNNNFRDGETIERQIFFYQKLLLLLNLNFKKMYRKCYNIQKKKSKKYIRQPPTDCRPPQFGIFGERVDGAVGGRS